MTDSPATPSYDARYGTGTALTALGILALFVGYALTARDSMTTEPCRDRALVLGTGTYEASEIVCDPRARVTFDSTTHVAICRCAGPIRDGGTP